MPPRDAARRVRARVARARGTTPPRRACLWRPARGPRRRRLRGRRARRLASRTTASRSAGGLVDGDFLDATPAEDVEVVLFGEMGGEGTHEGALHGASGDPTDVEGVLVRERVVIEELHRHRRGELLRGFEEADEEGRADEIVHEALAESHSDEEIVRGHAIVRAEGGVVAAEVEHGVQETRHARAVLRGRRLKLSKVANTWPERGGELEVVAGAEYGSGGLEAVGGEETGGGEVGEDVRLVDAELGEHSLDVGVIFPETAGAVLEAPVGVRLGVAPVGSGMPSRRVTSHPASQSALAAPKPPQPAPTTATLGLWPETTSSEGEDASAGADEVEAARTTTRAREATRRRRCAKHGAKNSGDATRAGMAADARVAVCRDRGGGRNETPRESRTPRGARSASWHHWRHGPRPDRRSLAETQSAARLLLGRASGFARTRRRCRRRASSPPARSTFARARAPPPARTRSDASAPSGAEPSPRAASRPRRSSSGTRSRPSACSWKAAPRWSPSAPPMVRALLAPDLVALGDALEDDAPHVTVAKVDAEEAPCCSHRPRGVGAYPTTLWLREGREVHRERRAPRRCPRAAHSRSTSSPRRRRKVSANVPRSVGPAAPEPPDAQSPPAPNVFGWLRCARTSRRAIGKRNAPRTSTGRDYEREVSRVAARLRARADERVYGVESMKETPRRASPLRLHFI